MKLNVMTQLRKKFHIAIAVIVLPCMAACTSTTPRLDMQQGMALEAAKAAQQIPSPATNEPTSVSAGEVKGAWDSHIQGKPSAGKALSTPVTTGTFGNTGQ